MKDSEKIFTLSSKSSTKYIPIKDIIYFESRRNKIIIHTIKGQESYYNTLISVWQSVKNLNTFIMPHRSFIFNLTYVAVRFNKIIIKKTEEIFNIGEKYSNDTRCRYMSFIEKRWE